jgi:hypothetical protein
VPVMQQVLSVGSNFRHKGQALWVESVRDSVLSWLTERYDRDDLKETWMITMEAAVTILVFFELLVGIGSLIYTGYEFNAQNKQFKDQVQHQDEQFKTQKEVFDTQLGVLRSLLKSSQQSSDILDADEKRRLAEAKTAPNVKLTYGDKIDGLPKFTRGIGAGRGRRIDFILRNTGTADATGIRIIVSGGTGIGDIICNDESFEVGRTPIGEGERVSVRKRIKIPDTLGKKIGKIGLSLTFIGQGEINSEQVHFEVITDQHPTPLDLGSTTIGLRL